MTALAPIALFVYNRPVHTLQVLEALASNKLAGQSRLYIFSDGPKPGALPEAIRKIELVREVIRRKKWCLEVEIIEQPNNLGLAQALIMGVSRILNEFDRVIVLEDDIVPSPVFLSFMNDALETYRSAESVISISSFNFFALSDRIPDVFFSQLVDCWGWATWRRGWDLFEEDAAKLLVKIDQRQAKTSFNVNDAYDYYGMLSRTASNELESWAIRWYASGFIHDKVSLYPKVSLSKNIGFDGTGVNSGLHVYSDGRQDWPADYPSLTGRPVENHAGALIEFHDYFHPKKGRRLKRWYRRLGLTS